MRGLNIAIVGATGLVGQEFVKILEQRQLPVNSLRPCASTRSAGSKIFFNHTEIEVNDLSQETFEHVDLAFFSAGTDVSMHYAPIAARAGAVVVDNSAAFRMDQDTPLVVPEVNPGDLDWHNGIIANPNCSTIQMVVALYPLHRVNPIKRIIVDTYQSVSGTGSVAMEELSNQSKLVLEGHTIHPHVFPHQIAFNLLPEIDVFMDSGYSKEEMKMIQETRKIMHAPEIAISATCVRVPVYVSHSEAIHVEFTDPITPDKARTILAEARGIKVQDDPDISLYPHPWAVAGHDEVFVGRLRQDLSHPNGLAMWVVADNIRKGAALNGVQIAEELLRRGWNGKTKVIQA